MTLKHKYALEINGETVENWHEKSHAQIFRNFWDYFKNEDLKKTVETIELVGIRISNEAIFVAKNGSKKKNIHIDGELYVYGHLTPALMKKTYEKFLQGWEGKFVKPEEKKVDKPEKSATPAKPQETPKAAEKPKTTDKPQADKPAPPKTKAEPKKDEPKRSVEEILAAQREAKAKKEADKKAKAEAKKAEAAAKKAETKQLTAQDISEVKL